MSQILWREWGDEAFAEAKRLGRPILLFLQAAWCRYCRRMDFESFADAAVVELAMAQYVPVRVDKDRRPEVNERYNVGGWPSVCVLTQDGELVTGNTYLGPDDLRDFLARVARYWSDNQEHIASTIRARIERERADAGKRRGAAGQVDAAIVERVVGAILGEFDTEYGGFGSGQKFPHPESIDFALLHFEQTGDARLRDVVEKTLTAMVESPLHDAEEGGFFRYSTTRDWRTPHTEKLLETNVGLLRNFLEAYQILERKDYRKVAERIVLYLRTHLRHPELPAYFGSQDSDEDYYARTLVQRRTLRAPAVDRTLYTNWNAAAVSALFKASAVLDDASCARNATDLVEWLIEECHAPGRGMYHYHDGHGRHILGLLTDQAYMLRALLHATQYTGERRYLDVAEDLLGTLMSKHAAPEGGFFDLPADARGPGGLRRRNVSILENALIAEACLRAYHLTQKEAYLEAAHKTLLVFTEDYHLYGYFTAGYARAVDLFLHAPIHAVIVGKRGEPATDAMIAAATRLYLPSKLVQVIDPALDDDLLSRFELPREPAPAAYVHIRRTHVGSATDADQLVALMQKAAEAAR